jgi:WD40 repeat protein/serine/threonine protein kinase
MTPSSSGAERDILGELAEDYAARLRRGEDPPLSDYTERYPELAEEIRELFPALAVMEQLKSGGSQGMGPPPGRAGTSRDRLGDYLILREVGRGGMGVVYEAEQESLGRHVALKVLPAHALTDARIVLRFRREAKAAARLHHTNIVPVFGVGEHEGIHYYVMQFIQGRGLDEVIKELRRLRQPGPPTGAGRSIPGPGYGMVSAADVAIALASGQFARPPSTTVGSDPGAWLPRRDDAGAMPTASFRAAGSGNGALPDSPGSRSTAADDGGAPGPASGLGGLADPATSSAASRRYWREVARIGVQVARALEYAHAQGILHRDIKPSNLLLDLQGTVWVADFGLAKAIADADLTHTGDVVGTLRYMAPERFNGRADPRSDLYALGLTLYELLTLRPAFEAADRNRLIRQITEEEPPRPRRLVPEIPRDLETICLKCIEKRPSARYASAEALAGDLERWLEGRPITARPVSALERAAKWARRKPALAGLIAFSATGLVSGVVTVGWYNIQLARALAESRFQQRRSEGSAYIANANLVRRAIEVDDIAGALAGLASLGPEGRRGFEWPYLRRLCDYELLDRWETGEPVQSLAYSPDGTRIATGHGYSTDQGFDDRPGWIQVRDAGTGRLVHSFEAHRGPVFALAFSPDGQHLATGGGDRVARLWDARDGRPIRELGRYAFEVNDVAFSKDGRRVAVASGEHLPRDDDGRVVGGPGEVVLWDVAAEDPVWRRTNPNGTVLSVAYTPDGSRLAWGGMIAMYFSDPDDGRILDRAARAGGGRPAFSPDGHWLVSYGQSSPAWARYGGDGRDGERIARPYSRGSWGGWSSGVAFQPPDGKRIALTYGSLHPNIPDSPDRRARRRVVQIWDTYQAVPLHALVAHRASLRGVQYRPTDGNQLATADADGIVLLWQPTRAKPAAATRPGPSPVRALAFRPDAGRLAAGCEDGIVRIEDVGLSGPPTERAGHDRAVLALACSPDGSQLASAGQDATIRLGPAHGANAPVVLLRGHTGPVHGLMFRPDGRQLASASADGSVRLWDPDGRRPALVLAGHSGIVLGLAYSPDGSRLASVGGDGTVRLWDSRTGRVLRSWPTGAGAGNAVTFVGADGRMLATAGGDKVIHLWDVENGRPIRDFTGHTADVFALAYGGVGQPRLVSAGKDQTVRLWDPETGQEMMTLGGHTDSVMAVAFTRDGRLLASAGADRSVRLWDARTSPHVRAVEGEFRGAGSVSGTPNR